MRKKKATLPLSILLYVHHRIIFSRIRQRANIWLADAFTTMTEKRLTD